MRIVITDGYAVNPGDLSWEWLEKFGDVAVYDKLTDAAAPAKIGDAEVVFTNRVKIAGAVLAACPNLKYVSALGTGYDMIDVEQCRARGIEVCNVPGYSTDSVAQVAFSLLLANAFDLYGYAQMVKEGHWTGIPGFHYELTRSTSKSFTFSVRPTSPARSFATRGPREPYPESPILNWWRYPHGPP